MARIITLFGSVPCTINPPIITLSPVCTKERVEMLPSRAVGVGVNVAVAVGVGVGVRVAVGVGVGVNVAVAVGVGVRVAVGVGVNVAVAVGVAVGVRVAVGLAVGVAVGHATPTVDTSTMFVSLVVPSNPPTTTRRLPTAAPLVQECGAFMFGPEDQVLLGMS